jgi:hypothetical protein
MLFVGQQLQTWRRSETIRLYILKSLHIQYTIMYLGYTLYVKWNKNKTIDTHAGLEIGATGKHIYLLCSELPVYSPPPPPVHNLAKRGVSHVSNHANTEYGKYYRSSSSLLLADQSFHRLALPGCWRTSPSSPSCCRKYYVSWKQMSDFINSLIGYLFVCINMYMYVYVCINSFIVLYIRILYP